MVRRIALWGPLLIAALLVGAYVAIHQPFVRDGTELLSVPLSEGDTELTTLGQLIYRGGLDIPRMGQDLGGLSALRWDEETVSLIALTDDARWVRITTSEMDGHLDGLAQVVSGPLMGLQGETLSGKAQGDSESLTRSAKDGWLVGFERDHRIWRYPSLKDRPVATGIDPVAIMGPLEDNGGTETLAVDERALFLCAQADRPAPEPNCYWQTQGMGPSPLRVEPPVDMRDVGAVPTDADIASDASVFVLFRSYSPSGGSVCGITRLRPGGTQESVATFRAPLTVDNFEGLAVREETGRTFLYIVSDDNFSGDQRTLLMKFEVAGAPS
ncbi:MAG: esterase-like activity of phytase family protein [Pseudomonadota bacterium]